MATRDSYLIKGYDLSGGDTTWLSDNISDFTTYFVKFIWSNVTGTLDGSLLIRDTDDNKLFNSLETVLLDTEDESRDRPNINVIRNKLSVKFTANGVTGGRLSIKVKSVENKLQAHNSDENAHATKTISIREVKNGNHVLIDNDDIVLFDTGNTNRTLDLQLLAGARRKVYRIGKIDSGSGKVILDGNGSETISGDATKEIISQNDFVSIVPTTDKWYIV